MVPWLSGCFKHPKPQEGLEQCHIRLGVQFAGLLHHFSFSKGYNDVEKLEEIILVHK
jgi:hypothetical protein